MILFVGKIAGRKVLSHAQRPLTGCCVGLVHLNMTQGKQNIVYPNMCESYKTEVRQYVTAS